MTAIDSFGGFSIRHLKLRRGEQDCCIPALAYLVVRTVALQLLHVK